MWNLFQVTLSCALSVCVNFTKVIVYMLALAITSFTKNACPNGYNAAVEIVQIADPKSFPRHSR